MRPHIRRAGRDDYPALLSLLEELGYPMTEEELEERFSNFGAHLNVCVATLDSDIAGMIAYSNLIPRLAEGGTFVRITALSVTAVHRRSGVAKALVDHVEREAQASGSVIIEVSSGRRASREAAHTFYLAMGYGHVVPISRLS